MPHVIYGLVDPSSGAIRYVGRSEDPRARLADHLHEAFDAPESLATAKCRWLRSLSSPPALRILEEVSPDEDPAWRERYWIMLLRHRGADLTNAHFVGDSSAPPARAEPRATVLGERLRVFRIAAAVSTRDLSRRIGGSPSLVSHIEVGRIQDPSIQTVLALARELGVSILDLVGDAVSAQKGAA